MTSKITRRLRSVAFDCLNGRISEYGLTDSDTPDVSCKVVRSTKINNATVSQRKDNMKRNDYLFVCFVIISLIVMGWPTR
jgi:hypothetical protein